MIDPVFAELGAAILLELRIANDLKALELDETQKRSGSDSLVFSVVSDRRELDKKLANVRSLLGVR